MPGNEVQVGAAADFPTGRARAVRVNGESVVVVRLEDGLCAVRNRCSHLPLPLAGGRVEGGAITCPFHGSRFDLRTGRNLDWVTAIAGRPMPQWSRSLIALGRTPQPVPAYTVTERDGAVYVEP